MLEIKNLYISIIIYLIVSFSILYYKPSFLFADKNKKKLKYWEQVRIKINQYSPLVYTFYFFNKILYILWYVVF